MAARAVIAGSVTGSLYDGCKVKLVTEVTVGLMQGRTGPLQSRCKGSICEHPVSAFGNSVSIPIVVLGLLGHCNGYRATVTVICNRYQNSEILCDWVIVLSDNGWTNDNLGLQ
jgi:hypothetical protein